MIIKIACHRSGPNWPETSSTDLATAITEAYRLNPLSILEFFQAIIAAGGAQAELAPLYGYQKLIEHLERALANGDLAAVQVCVGLAADLESLSQETTDAIEAVIAANSLRLVDIVAAEIGEDAPETVTTADVDAALGR
jgi:hypothetical protein